MWRREDENTWGYEHYVRRMEYVKAMPVNPAGAIVGRIIKELGSRKGLKFEGVDHEVMWEDLLPALVECVATPTPPEDS